MKKFIGVIGNPQLDITLLNKLENIVVNNLEVKNAMREEYIQKYLNFFNENVETSKYLETFDKPKSKYHK